MSETLQKFLNRVSQSAEKGYLVKMTLSKPAQKHDELRNVYVKPVLIKEKRLFAFTYHYERRDEVKNYDATQMLDMLKEMLPNRFLNAVLFTVDEDITLLVSSKGKATIQTKKVQECREQNLEHDKQKVRLINPANPWWYQLGLTTREGKITADMQHKFKQIYKYAEIVESLVKPMKFDGTVHIADMGAGKGYLTFALHELLTQRLNLEVDIKGVEIRPDLVQKINEIGQPEGLGVCGEQYRSLSSRRAGCADCASCLQYGYRRRHCFGHQGGGGVDCLRTVLPQANPPGNGTLRQGGRHHALRHIP